jgi:type II secretory ATPase GspE/PulE/Tfp pilus assembly ATPase PilB-like protein
MICPHCREKYLTTGQERSYLGMHDPPSHLFRGRGCERCTGKGYLGRTGIYELLEITPDIRSMIIERKDASSIREAAVAQGFKTLQQNSTEKIVNGVTTIEEVLRLTHRDSRTFI